VSWTDVLLVFFRAAFLSVNGSTTLALLKEDLVDRLHVLSASEFATGVVVGSISPGPMGYGAIALGFLADGWRGAIVATLTSWLPAFLVIPLRAGYRKLEGRSWVGGLSWGVAGAGAGLLIGLTAGIVQSSVTGWREGGIAAAIVLMLALRVPVAGAIAAGAVMGAIFLR
jgi:chromate transporter